MGVPFIDISRDVQAHRDEYLLAAARVLDSGIFSLGPEVEKFEKEFADYLGVKHVIGVNGGTLALYAAFLALEIGHGDEVIIPSNTFIATAEAVVMAGARPVFCDVNKDSHLLDIGSCVDLISVRTKAIVPVHLYGHAVNMDEVISFSRKYKLRVVEDCAQAHGSKYGNSRVGSIGDIGCFSFYPTKNLGALGEGGAISTNDDALARRLRAIRLHGIMEVKYRHDIMGSNLKMEALQAAFLSLRLCRLDHANNRRREIAKRYRDSMSELPIELPIDLEGSHVYYQFVIQTEKRDDLQRFLTERGIGNGIYYPQPVHLQGSMQCFGGRTGDCPVVEAEAKKILSLPIFPELSEREVKDTVSVIKEFYL
jgi:dTDP-4-amino-4,6-dideoxygalactose transaminase